MGFKIASAGRSVKEFSDLKAEEKAAEDSAEQEGMKAFGFTKAEAFRAIQRQKEVSSADPVEDLWVNSPLGAWTRANELAGVVAPGKAAELVQEAMSEASSPKDFWTRLRESLEGDEEGE